MVLPIQILLIVFLLFALSRVFIQSRVGGLKTGEVLFWISLFSLAIVGVVDPGFLGYLASQLGIGRGADVAIYLSIVLLFYLIFRTNVLMEDLRHEITKVVREVALREVVKNQKTKTTKIRLKAGKK